MTDISPYHEGERAVQARVNETNRAIMSGKVISSTIPSGALCFIEQQSMVVIGSMDSQGRVWASVLFGQPGFLRAIDARTLELRLDQAGVSMNEMLWSNLQANASIGLIVIELGSRRRLRVNGRLRKTSPESYQLDVQQAYPNCPRYIQRRFLKIANMQLGKHVWTAGRGIRLNPDQQALITNSDTLFVASAHLDQGVDASHRGGKRGFVQVLNGKLIRVPDYPGNGMFNTLGNFHSYPYAGLVFIDFQGNRLLQLTGKTEILWHVDIPDEQTGGTLRYWQFEIESWLESEIPFKIDWEFLEYSRFNP